MRNTIATPASIATPRQLPSPGTGASGSVVRELNPPFDVRLTSTGGANPAMKNRPLKRGRVIRAATTPYQVNFMFNPSVLGVTFAIDDSNPDPTKTDTGQFGGAQANLPGQGQISVDLLFDRTYEVWERKNTIAAKFGVHADVLAFYAFLGMIQPGFNVSTSWEDLYPTSQIIRSDSFLYIGDRLKYYGYITSLSVQYVHWSYDMVPTRAALSLGYNVLLTTPTAQAAANSGSADPGTKTTPEAIPGQDYYVGPVT